jgi:acyl-CoA thioester hydrolase
LKHKFHFRKCIYSHFIGYITSTNSIFALQKLKVMYSLSITPKFADIDGLGHVNNTVLPGWFEQARNQIYRYFNPDFDFKNWNLILARYEIDFVSQLFYDQDVEIKTWISHIGRSSFEVYQEAWQNDSLATIGKTVLVHFDFKAQKSAKIPPEILEQMNEHLITAAEILASKHNNKKA